MALFGSFARNEAQAHSDVDLLIEFGRKSFDTFMAVLLFLKDLLGRRVDLVTTEALGPYIGPHIIRDAEDALHAA